VSFSVWLTWFLTEALVAMLMALFGGAVCWLFDVSCKIYGNVRRRVRHMFRHLRRTRRRALAAHVVSAAMGEAPPQVPTAPPDPEHLAFARPLVSVSQNVDPQAHIATVVAALARRFGEVPVPHLYSAVVYALREHTRSVSTHAAAVTRLRRLSALRSHAEWRSWFPRWFNDRFTGGGVSGWFFRRKA